MIGLRSDVGHVENGPPSDVTLYASGVAVESRCLDVLVESLHRARERRPRRLQQRRHRPVEDLRVQLQRWVARRLPVDVAGHPRVVEDAGARTDRRLAVARQVPREPEPRLHENTGAPSRKPFRIARVRADHEAVVRIAGPGNQRANQDGRRDRASHRVARLPHAVHQHGLIELLSLARIVAFQRERRRGTVLLVPMRVPREARSVVQRELARDLPGVLREPLDHAGCSVAARTGRRLDVRAVRSQQRVRVRMARVERVHGIHVELEVAVERPRLPFLVAGMLQIEARLERVISACERRGVVDGHERIGARQRETSFEGNGRRIRNCPGERRARDDVRAD